MRSSTIVRHATVCGRVRANRTTLVQVAHHAWQCKKNVDTVHHSFKVLLSISGNFISTMQLVPYLSFCSRAARAACSSFLRCSLACSMSVLCTGLFSKPLTSSRSRCQEQGTQRVGWSERAEGTLGFCSCVAQVAHVWPKCPK